MPNIGSYLRIPSVIVSIFKTSYRTGSLACLQYNTGSYAYAPALHGMKVGLLVTYIDVYTIIRFRNSFYSKIGSIIHLYKLPRYSIISNLSVSDNSKSVYARSAGTYVFLDEILSEIGMSIVKLPSGTRRVVALDSLVMLGRNSNISQKYRVEGKASYGINRGKKQITRGVAMNPVDHPNGGRTKTNKPEKSI